jgi:hypothetical protein
MAISLASLITPEIKSLIEQGKSRHVEIYLTTSFESNNKWYIHYPEREFGHAGESDTYGPFDSEELARNFLRERFAVGNFKKVIIDNSGQREVPKRSPSGKRIERGV